MDQCLSVCVNLSQTTNDVEQKTDETQMHDKRYVKRKLQKCIVIKEHETNCKQHFVFVIARLLL